MQTRQIEIAAFSPDHLEAAVALSRRAGWPHRPQDWQMALTLSEGVVAIENDRVVGTVLITRYKRDCATINMVIVDETMRGRSLGRRLMEVALQIAGYRLLPGDPEEARALAGRLRAGSVRLNSAAWDSAAPFGGYKQSGNGREYGKFGLHEFTEVKGIVGFLND
ncbi:GNAT superfamily N-acetyltransferase [Rhizobium sp. BK049]|nr:GNAT superfamily N-acetyltransferase [Rhizobium sp. BK049]